MAANPELIQALEDSRTKGTYLRHELRRARIESISTVDDALAICDALRQIDVYEDSAKRRSGWRSPLTTLGEYFLNPSSEAATDAFFDEGLPLLLDYFNSRLDHVHYETDILKRLDRVYREQDRLQRDLLFVLWILAEYGSERTAACIQRAFEQPIDPNDQSWCRVFGAITGDHPAIPEIAEQSVDSLPDGLCTIAFLDCMNLASIAGNLGNHPFDTEQGREHLKGWIESADELQFSYAQSAAASLPFIRNPERDQLLAVAMDHPDPPVQLEAAWASSRIGSESGLKMLARFCMEPELGSIACKYLVELGKEDMIPEEAREKQ
ncbi:MAG: HEAT repeat domain-containing protein [Pirellulaceae bacterium]